MLPKYSLVDWVTVLFCSIWHTNARFAVRLGCNKLKSRLFGSVGRFLDQIRPPFQNASRIMDYEKTSS